MQDPSVDTDTPRLSSSESIIHETSDLCSLRLIFILWTVGSIDQTLISPSAPPEMIPPFCKHMIADTPWLCASLICYSSLPDLGANARILPSDHPDTMDVPSMLTLTHMHSTPGISTRVSSTYELASQMRIFLLEQVRNIWSNCLWNTTSLIAVWCAVYLSSLFMEKMSIK